MLNNSLKTAAAILLMGMTSATLANQVLLENTSKTGKPLKVEYRVAHKNIGQNTVLSAASSVLLSDRLVIQFELEGNDLAGIVPIAVDGHRLPPEVREFAKPQQCVIATNKSTTTGTLALTYTGTTLGHGSISCAATGGVHE